jgi:hypothetical protein
VKGLGTSAASLQLHPHSTLKRQKSTMVSFSIQEEPEEDNHDVIIPVEQLARDIEKEIERCKTGLRSNAARRSCCIYNVPLSYRFKNNDDSSYRPRSVSIGPYCYDDKKLDGDYKYQCLDFFLSRTYAKGIGLKLEDFMEKLHTLEGQARACYSEKIDLKSGEFLKMMVVDASFILGLFYKFQDRGPFQTVEPLKWRLQYLYEDLLLFQNQIPFFVLQELFNISKKPNDPSLYLLALQFFNNVMRRPKAVIKRYAKDLEMSYADPQNRPLHLLDLVRSCLIPSNPNLMRSRDEVILFDKLFDKFVVCLEKLFPSTLTNKLDNILEYVVQLRFLFKKDEDDDDTQVQFIPCISRLRRSGIRVRPSNAERLLEVKFEYGVIKMPSITMDDFMISLLLNCLAFEQFHGSSSYPKYVTVYATFLDCLVNTTEDVQYLRDCNIIDNSLAEDDTVAQFINSLGKDLNFGKGDFYLDKVFNAVDKYYRKRFNVQRASFKHKYLNSPWSCISVLAATVLLLLTLAQTVFTILAYAHPQK